MYLTSFTRHSKVGCDGRADPSDSCVDAPLDFGLDCFFESRKEVIEACLERVRSESLFDLLEVAWQHKGERCVGVSWTNWTLEELQTVCVCVGGNAAGRDPSRADRSRSQA